MQIVTIKRERKRNYHRFPAGKSIKVRARKNRTFGNLRGVLCVFSATEGIALILPGTIMMSSEIPFVANKTEHYTIRAPAILFYRRNKRASEKRRLARRCSNLLLLIL